MGWINVGGPGAHRGEAVRIARSTLSILVAIALVAGCNGGGGGGGSSAPTTPAVTGPTPVMGATAVEAEAPPAATNDVSLAATLLFPLYPLIANGVQQGTRVESTQGDITVSYRDSARNNAVQFLPGQTPAQILRDPDFLSASRGTTTYAEVNGDSNTSLALTSTRFGFLTYVDSATAQRAASPFYFGYETPFASVPMSGYAEYSGVVKGFLGAVGTAPNVEGNIFLRTNFDSGLVFGDISNLEQIDSAGNVTPLGITASLGTATDPGVAITRAAGQPHYKGSLTGTRASDGAAVTGSIDGRFFGYTAKETAGNITLNWDGQTLLGGYGALDDGGPLLSAPEVFATVAGETIASATGIAFPLKSNVGPVPTGSRTLAADGSLTLVYATAAGKSLITFLPANVQTLPDGTLRAVQDGRVYTERSRIDSGLNGDLRYSRFGTLQFTEGGESVQRPFAFGYATPDSRLPLTGTADYIGRTDGTYKSGNTSEALSGLVNLSANFASRAVTGQISAIEITGANGDVRRPGITFAIATPTTAGITDGAFTGALTGSGTGQLAGQFYGYNYDEVSGTWFANLGADTINGAFGSKRFVSGSGELAPWQSLTSGAVSLVSTFGATFASVAGVVSVGQPIIVGPSTLSPLADGGVALATTVRSVQRSATFSAGDLTPIPTSGTGINTMVSGTNNNMRMVLGGTTALTYTRFGYWEDLAAAPGSTVTNYFHAGAVTPGGSVPTTGTATYNGATVGQALAGGSLLQIQGQMTMTANFAARTMNGTLSGFTATNGAGASATSPITSVTMTGSYSAGANTFAGTTQSAIVGQPTAATGTFEGQFHGRNAQEIGGTWNAGGNAWGAFGGSR